MRAIESLKSISYSIFAFVIYCLLLNTFCQPIMAQNEDLPLRVFIFAGQSNMVGSDSRAADIVNFPPFQGLENAQKDVGFAYCIGRENKVQSKGWEQLQPVNQIVGPELSFARKVSANTEGRIAIIKVAAGGTHLGGDWNPDAPKGFKMYPLALEFVQEALSSLEREGIEYQLEGFMWHQGENDMFNEQYKSNYGANLKNFVACWRRDLECPNLNFFVGELCTKTIWGMDLRDSMYAISLGQKEVTDDDPLATYVKTAHVGVEIGGGVGLHYHYGTLGQLEHGENYADAYLKSKGAGNDEPDEITPWPYVKGDKVRLFVMAGHRNMEGERAFVQDLKKMPAKKSLLRSNSKIAFRYSLGGGYLKSSGWESLRPAGYYDTFGPELSFGKTLQEQTKDIGPIAVAKFTHSGSQINDWTPEGSDAKGRNLYPTFVKFVQESIDDLEARGCEVELAGVFYHLGENDMSFGPYRRQAASRLKSLIRQSRVDLARPKLDWFVSQQSPTDDPQVNQIDVVSEIVELAERDPHLIHIEAFDLLGQEKKLVVSTAGIVQLGELMATRYMERNSEEQ